MKINCENKFCVYYENSQCVLDSVSLDKLDICEQILIVSVEEELLVLKRKKLLEKFEQSDHY